MNDELSLTSDLLKIKKLIRSLQQTSYTAKKLEDRFPEVEFAPRAEMLQYIRTILALKFDVEDVLKDFNLFFKKYKDIHE